MILSSLIPPTTFTDTFGFFASYSAVTFLNSLSSRALQPTQTVSVVACALPGAADDDTAPSAAVAARTASATTIAAVRLIGPPWTRDADPRVPVPPTSFES